MTRHASWHAEDSLWKYEVMKPFLEQLDFQSCVDVGCGAGVVLRSLAVHHPGAQCDGYEVSADAAKLWDSDLPNLSYHHADIFANSDTYDLLISCDVLEHVEDYYGFLRALRDRAHYFIYHVPLDMFALASLTQNYGRKRKDVGHLHYFDKDTILEVMRECGYSLVDAKLTKAYKATNAKTSKKLRLLRSIGERLWGTGFNSRLLGGYSMMILLERAGQ